MSNFVEIDIDFDYCGEVDMVLAHDESGEHEDVRYYRDRGECHDTLGARWFQCSKCGFGIDDMYINDERKYIPEIVPRYCPWCGRRVVNA